MVNAAAIEFDAEHENDAEYITSASDHAGNFILGAWGTRTGRVSATRMTFDPNDNNLDHFKNKRHQHCITQPLMNAPGGLPPPPAVDQVVVLGLLNATIACQVDEQEAQNNILTKQLEHMVKKDRSAKNRVKNLHKSTIKMLFLVSAMDNKTLLTDLTDPCKQFINSKTAALAKQKLKLQFKNRGMTEVSFMMGYTSNIYHRLLLWSSADTPSNHMPFSFSEAKPIRMKEHKSRHLHLQLILTQGKRMTVEKIRASRKQEVHAPMNIHDMAKQLKMFMIANDIFLGEFSVGSQCLRSLQTMIDRNRSSFKARECLNKEFTPKFLFAVGSRYQIWLKQC